MKDAVMKDEPKRKQLLYLFIFHLVIIHLVAACGFQPVYKQSGAPTELSMQLRGIDVPVLQGSRPEQLFSVTLADLLDPQSRAEIKPYLLELAYKREEQPAVIQQDRRITRYRITLTALYLLREKETGKELTRGNATIRTSYDDLSNEFANYSAQTDSEERAVKELAQRIRQQLLGYFGRQ